MEYKDKNRDVFQNNNITFNYECDNSFKCIRPTGSLNNDDLYVYILYHASAIDFDA